MIKTDRSREWILIRCSARSIVLIPVDTSTILCTCPCRKTGQIEMTSHVVASEFWNVWALSHAMWRWIRTDEWFFIYRDIEWMYWKITSKIDHSSSAVNWCRCQSKTYSNVPYRSIIVEFKSKKQRFRSNPFHSWTPTMPKMEKTKKHRRSKLPRVGRVSISNMTRMRMDGMRWTARKGRSTRTVRMIDKLRWSPGNKYSTSLNVKRRCERRCQLREE